MTIDYQVLSELIAEKKLADMSREELENYAYGYILDCLDDMSENELLDLAEEYGVEYGKE